MKKTLQFTVLVVAMLAIVSCSAKPNEASLRESFAQQLKANKFVTDFRQSGDDLSFSGPGADGGTAKWRVHIDSATIESNEDEAQPIRGLVKSSWYSNDQLVRPRLRESNLPLELISNGLAQECWALWDKATKKWGWE